MSKGKLNTKTVGFLAGLVIVAVLAVSSIFLLQTPVPGEESSSESSSESVTLSSHLVEDVVSVDIKASYGDYTVLVDEEGNAYIEQLEGYPRNENGLYSILADAAEIIATQLVEENPTDLDKYGLENPVGTSTVTYSDGSTFQLKVGDTASQNKGVYVQTEDGKVYLMAEQDVWGLMSPMTEYVDRRLVPPLENSSEVVESCKTAGLESITIGGSLRESPIEITFDKESGTFYMTAPVRRKVSDAGVEKLRGMFGIYASHVVNLEPTQQDITDAGLDNPETEITFTYEDQTVVLRLDGVENELLSAMRSDVDILYDLDMGTISFMELQYTDLLASEYIVDSQEDITSLEMTVGGASYILVPGDTPTVNGQVVDSEAFTQFMTMVLSARSEGQTSETVSGEPDMTLTVRLSDSNRQAETLKLYYDGIRSYYVDCNGSVTTYIKSSYVDNVSKALTALLAGEEFSVDW